MQDTAPPLIYEHVWILQLSKEASNAFSKMGIPSSCDGRAHLYHLSCIKDSLAGFDEMRLVSQSHSQMAWSLRQAQPHRTFCSWHYQISPSS